MIWFALLELLLVGAAIGVGFSVGQLMAWREFLAMLNSAIGDIDKRNRVKGPWE